MCATIGRMAIKLHRCPVTFVKGRHPCWVVEEALQQAGVDYEVVKEPLLRPRRKDLQARSGQQKLPVIETEDGTMIRAESQDLAARVRAGEFSPRSPGDPNAAPPPP